ncbi:MAG: hypothetical protein WC627_05825 [Legionella sp.]|jgi:hypothetical protein
MASKQDKVLTETEQAFITLKQELELINSSAAPIPDLITKLTNSSKQNFIPDSILDPYFIESDDPAAFKAYKEYQAPNAEEYGRMVVQAIDQIATIALSGSDGAMKNIGTFMNLFSALDAKTKAPKIINKTTYQAGLALRNLLEFAITPKFLNQIPFLVRSSTQTFFNKVLEVLKIRLAIYETHTSTLIKIMVDKEKKLEELYAIEDTLSVKPNDKQTTEQQLETYRKLISEARLKIDEWQKSIDLPDETNSSYFIDSILAKGYPKPDLIAEWQELYNLNPTKYKPFEINLKASLDKAYQQVLKKVTDLQQKIEKLESELQTQRQTQQESTKEQQKSDKKTTLMLCKQQLHKFNKIYPEKQKSIAEDNKSALATEQHIFDLAVKISQIDPNNNNQTLVKLQNEKKDIEKKRTEFIIKHDEDLKDLAISKAKLELAVHHADLDLNLEETNELTVIERNLKKYQAFIKQLLPEQQQALSQELSQFTVLRDKYVQKYHQLKLSKIFDESEQLIKRAAALKTVTEKKQVLTDLEAFKNKHRHYLWQEIPRPDQSKQQLLIKTRENLTVLNAVWTALNLESDIDLIKREFQNKCTYLEHDYFTNKTSVFPKYLNDRASKYALSDWFESWIVLSLRCFGYKSRAEQRKEFIMIELKTAFDAYKNNPENYHKLDEIIDTHLQKFPPRSTKGEEFKMSLHFKLIDFKSKLAKINEQLLTERAYNQPSISR